MLGIFFDGVVKAKGVGIEAILISPIGQHYPAIARLQFFYTNNTTEYKACIMGMNIAFDLDIHGDLIQAPPSELHPISAPWSFVASGMDVIGLIKPKASNGHRFVLVTIDYFTKWVEAVTFNAVTKKAVPFDEGANGVVEAANKKIKKILRKMIQDSRQLHEKFPFALLGYCTTMCTLVGATPYLLVYGTEAVIPAEAEIPSLRIIIEVKIEDDEWVKTRLEQLIMIDEKRMAAVCHRQLYQQRMARAYNKKVRPRKLELGKVVLRQILPHHEEAKRKFVPN
ncbi:uncharacterized protein [Nicotiana sylvestris]|uniref:uncharacterized protein n=1 Tax=Nicotiana sylvestris TaxID=4096 RepID=UPI00388CB5C7